MTISQDIYIKRFTRGFLECLLWSEHVFCGDDDDQGEPADENHSADDIDAEGMAEIVADCRGFVEGNWTDLQSVDRTPEQAGHDFCLTRNRHGAGFWDGDWPEPQASRLTDDSHVWGSLGLDVADDGTLYVHN